MGSINTEEKIEHIRKRCVTQTKILKRQGEEQNVIEKKKIFTVQ